MSEQIAALEQLTGVYGGAFDPVHNDHVLVMQTAIRELGLKRLVVVPSAAAPHKHIATSWADRAEMLRLATQHIPEVVIDPIETEIEGPAYSSVVLPLLAAKYGPIVHIIGGDSLINMPQWHCPEEVMRFPHAVMPRGDDNGALQRAMAKAEREYHADITVLPCLHTTFSSTSVRLFYRIGRTVGAADIPQRHSPKDYSPLPNGVCAAVNDYIRTHDLYDEYAYIVREVPQHISPSRWAHTQEVALMAMVLNGQLHLPEQKVLTAALLHDCMKGALHIYPDVPADCRQPAVVHAFNGAEEARHRYGVQDEDILNAIRYHTTGRAMMSPLEQLIYLADYCEATRVFPGAEEVRALALTDFRRGFVQAVRNTHAHVADTGGDICPLGEECYRYYCKQ